MGYSSSLSDQEWEIIEPLLPRKKKTRPPTWTKRQICTNELVEYDIKRIGLTQKCPESIILP